MAYAVVGAMAVLSYVPYRTTRDLDVLIEPTRENGDRARQRAQQPAWCFEERQLILSPRLPLRPVGEPR
jgi:hypothetical protein